MKRRTPDDDSDPDLLDEWMARKKPVAGFQLTTPVAVVLAGIIVSATIVALFVGGRVYDGYRERQRVERTAEWIKEKTAHLP